MNKEQQQIIDEVYNNYWEETFKSQGTEWVESLSGMSLGTGELTTVYRQYTKKDLIEKIKTDIKFSEKFKLKIEERELSLEERTKYKMKRDNIARTIAPYTHQILNNSNVPTKLITLTYNNETIESYE
jgi:hypothetical protein